jgi:hypothetical protein
MGIGIIFPPNIENVVSILRLSFSYVTVSRTS